MGLNPFPLFPQKTLEQRGVDLGPTQTSGARLLLEPNSIPEPNPICLRSIDVLESNRLSRALMRRGSRRARRRLANKKEATGHFAASSGSGCFSSNPAAEACNVYVFFL